MSASEPPSKFRLSSDDKQYPPRPLADIRDLPCEKEIHRKHRIHGIEIRVYPCPPWKKNNPQMLNRSETDGNPYNICLTSADNNHIS